MEAGPPEVAPTTPVEQPIKKKRGRPPKNPPSSNTPTPTPTQGIAAGDQEAKPLEPKSAPPSVAKTTTFKRGRPTGTKNRISKAGPPLIPNVLVIPAGEDVVERLKDISRSYGRSVCVLAATGTLTSACLMQVGTNGDGVGIILKTNGVFTVLSISGAVLQGASGEASKSRAKSREPMVFLTASLANPSGGVVGGQVAGSLEAAGPVTLVVGHWEPDRENTMDQGASGSAQADAVSAEPSSVLNVGNSAGGAPLQLPLPLLSPGVSGSTQPQAGAPPPAPSQPMPAALPIPETAPPPATSTAPMTNPVPMPAPPAPEVNMASQLPADPAPEAEDPALAQAAVPPAMVSVPAPGDAGL